MDIVYAEAGVLDGIECDRQRCRSLCIGPSPEFLIASSRNSYHIRFNKETCLKQGFELVYSTLVVAGFLFATGVIS